MSTAASWPEGAGFGLRLIEAYCGPSPYGDEPCVVAALQIPPDIASHREARCARIAQACAGWFTPPASTEQANDAESIATFLASLSLALLNKEGDMLHTASAWQEGGELRLCVGSRVVPITMAAIGVSTEMLAHVDTASPAELDRLLQRFWQTARAHHPDFQIRFLIEAAHAAGIPYLPFFRGHRLWQFGWGTNGNVFFESEPRGDSAIGWKVARDKLATKAVFAALGVRMPPHVLARSEAELPTVARVLGWPCVVKPAASGLNKGVTADVDSMEKLTAAFRVARSLEKGNVFVERQVEGDVYRIAVVRGEIAYVIRRSPPYVVGDGRSTVRALIEASNIAGAARRAELGFVGPIPLDAETEAYLSRQELGLDDVPAAGRKVPLRTIPSMRQGAIYDDVTDAVHPDTCTLALMLAESLGLETCGIDFISRDIARSCSEEGWMLEINTTPGLRQPLVAGLKAVDIGRQVLGETLGRIPVSLVLASEVDHERLERGLDFHGRAGWVVAGRCGLGTLSLGGQDGAAPDTARPSLSDLVSRILRNPLAESLTIVCTPAEIAESGLPVDRYDLVIACATALDPRWREVLLRRADAWLEVEHTSEALEAMRTKAG